MNFYLISLPVAALNCGRMIIRFNVMFIYGYGCHLLKLVWVFLSCSYISLNANYNAHFFPKVRFTKASFLSFDLNMILSI
jgi:hypothetical protein